MLYVGLDIHSRRISICVLKETGQVAHRSQVRTIDQMMQILERLPDRLATSQRLEHRTDDDGVVRVKEHEGVQVARAVCLVVPAEQFARLRPRHSGVPDPMIAGPIQIMTAPVDMPSVTRTETRDRAFSLRRGDRTAYN